MAKAQARAQHIIVSSEKKALEILEKLNKGSSFEAMALRFSSCPSAKQGGDLGEFAKGDMVKSFDKAVFSGPLNEVIGPVKTQFGFHLIKVNERWS
ncbi:peptidyl-prolyl cis-trans isomerase [Agarivorans sp. OAG1]|uniref:peptidylprolyl isomerase n=1 Tax=Agarivorans albus MKT 106 TaxID=1331007 RepID=R9PGD2_AGAAL|nr:MULTISPECIES: peptidylprolyl isomerase [Agarivorans]MPW31208.1 peptidylprolyl isomerase [Agarivorans sp. B2Z047]UQN42828.1 peptidylprolyl isomerase [Agarivorans sp. B2Z047]BEU05339.1 peptidyl-prolyl cis-trans isomerase [Agarivorans sp. OAG1]GAD00440.1 peptidyl-prolyl cis-trans isomerase PpiC [Agarivorans albus MKT 106]